MNDPPKGYIQKLPGLYESEKPINITGIDEVHIKCDCFNESIVNGTREPNFYSFALEKPPAHKIYKQTRNENFKQIKKSVLHRITFYLEDDDQKPVNFKGKTISFTCQLIKV